MEHFFHVGPPFAFSLVGQGFLAGHANVPPLLRHRVGGHLRHVGSKVVASVFQIAEQITLAVRKLSQIDRIIADIALLDHVQNLRPDSSVQFFNSAILSSLTPIIHPYRFIVLYLHSGVNSVFINLIKHRQDIGYRCFFKNGIMAGAGDKSATWHHGVEDFTRIFFDTGSVFHH